MLAEVAAEPVMAGVARAGTVAGVIVGLSACGALLHATSVPTIAALANLQRVLFMVLLVLEALGALVLLLLIVWWTMFSGRDQGELPANSDAADAAELEQPKPPTGAPDDKA